MKAKDIIKTYAKEKKHLKLVSRLSCLFFHKIKNFYPNILIYDNEIDLNLLKYGGLFHDIGLKFEKKYKLPHNKAGCKFIVENKPDEINEKDLMVLGCLIRYHRKSFPSENHPYYKDLNLQDKRKVNYLGAIIRLMDSLDHTHIDLIRDFNVHYDEKLNILTLILPKNIMLNKNITEAIKKKKDLFEFVYETTVKLKAG